MSSYPAFLSPPRLCHLKKWTTFAGYGFNLHAEKGKAGQYIGKVDPDSPAEHGGLKTKDYLVEVNSVNVEDLSHQKVVEIVKEMPNSVTMLVVDYEAYKHCRENGVSINSSMPEVVSFTTPDSQPSATAAGVDEKQEKPIESVDQTAESSVTNAESVVNPSNEFTDRAQEDEDENVMPVGQEVIANPLDVEQQQQQQRQQQQQHHQAEASPAKHREEPQSAATSNGSSASATTSSPPPKDPVGNLSLEEMRAKIGNNRRTQVKMNPSSFSEKYSVFQAL
ncbi:hypothetical protein BOX15_Mlig024996g1 [Macrostomum lignano]|uniref:PDZ domain-containing protein n=1 Tax=Macrostomum lignano TaxID=282301 RepID=A0A267H680_9PLAT|nr:hypothetical protein BOX15_Mlig024996g1 [Macrostomum lignano]